ncbi:MAG: DUF4350 domain-containing protein [Candidatus Latescibacterota bacterium]|jgi:ABC-type uncharacterized transport system involved in gliding motility auxiliary subunit
MKSFTVPLSLLGAVLALAGGVAYLLGPETGYPALANVAMGLALIGVAGAANPALLRQYGRWLNAFWGSLMVLGIAAMVVFLAGRYPRRLDLTEGKLHSLSDLSVRTLEGLTADVAAVAFMEGGTNAALEALLKEYRVHGPRFSFELIDPDRDPNRAEAYGIRQYNTLVVESGGRQQRLTELTEKEITNAVLKVTRDRRERAYLTVGHGEVGAGDDPEGLGVLVGRLKEIDYGVEDSLFLARAGEVPADCAVLVVAGPRTPFLANEVEAVRRYLDRGGAVLALLDPLHDSGLGPLLSEWGVRVGDDFVIDTSGIGSLFGLDFTTPVAVAYGDHPITRRHRGVMTFYRLARSVGIDSTRVGDREAVELASTSDQGWAEHDLSVLQEGGGKRTVQLDPGVDRPGPVPLAVAVTGSGTAGGSAARLVVFGDSDLATNQFFDYQGNGDLVLNAVSWLAEDESLISIRPRQAGHNPISLTESQGEWIFWITVILLPAVVAAVGFAVVSRKGRWSLADLAAAGLGIVLSLAVVVLVNYVGGRYHHRFDTTAEGLFTLSPETRELLAPLTERGQSVQVKTFLRQLEGQRLRDLLVEYRSLSSNFDFEVIDPQRNALQAKQHGVRELGTTVVEVTAGGKVRTERTTEQTEGALSNAIRRALRSGDQQVWFVGGHGEANLDQVDGAGFSILKGRLREQNLEIGSGQSLAAGVPEEVALVVAVAPKTPFSPAEVEALRRHLQRGGSLLLLLDPGGRTGLEGFLAEQGVTLGQDFVVDLSGLGQLLGADVSVPVVLQYGDHPATERLARGTMSFFPMARSVSPVSGAKGEVKSLALTHRSSWGETDLGPLSGAGGGKVDFDPAVDLRGPVSLAVAAKVDADTGSGPPAKARLVVFGDSDFASNQYFGQQANGELLMGAVNWLSEGEDKLEIPDRQPPFNPINLVGNQGTVILWISVFVLPFAVALFGLAMVLKRGYESYVDGIATWLAYTFAANAAFLLASGVIDLSGASWPAGQAKVVMAVLCGGAAYGVFVRARWAWGPAAVLALASALAGFWIIPGQDESVVAFYLQLLNGALFAVNAALLLWVRKGFAREAIAR